MSGRFQSGNITQYFVRYKKFTSENMGIDWRNERKGENWNSIIVTLFYINSVKTTTPL